MFSQNAQNAQNFVVYSSTIQNLLNLADTSSNIFATRTLIPIDCDDVDRSYMYSPMYF